MEAQVPFEQTLASIQPSTVSAEDIRCYVNVNLSRLERFVERELYFREAAEQMVPDAITKDEVIDEVIAGALGDGGDKPDKMALESWLYRLAIHAIGDLLARSSDNVVSVHLEDSARMPNVRASDEPELQFHQPDETLTKESVIADRRVQRRRISPLPTRWICWCNPLSQPPSRATAKFLFCTPWKDSRWRRSLPLLIAGRNPSMPRSWRPGNTCGGRRPSGVAFKAECSGTRAPTDSADICTLQSFVALISAQPGECE